MNIGDLQRMTVKKAREVALELDKVSGVHGMSKEEIISAFKALIEEQGTLTLPSGVTIEAGGEIEGGPKPAKVRKTIDKAAAKSQIKLLKSERDSALESKDGPAHTQARRKIKRLKRQLRKVS